MAKLIDLQTFTDDRGKLTVIEKVLPFEVKRIFYIYGVDDSTRGHHRHHKTIQAAISIQGSCDIYCQKSSKDETIKYELSNPGRCLLIYPEDYHWMQNFSKDCILMVLASEHYNSEDYIFDPYSAQL